MKPTRADLRAACAAGVVEPESMCPGRKDHIPFGLSPVNPLTLQPGDQLGLKGKSGAFVLVEIAAGQVGLVGPGVGFFHVDPGQIVEGPTMLSSVNYAEFQDGYTFGFESFVLEMPLGNKSAKRKPSCFGRGFKYGYKDAEEKRFRDVADAYNECARDLRALFPSVHWARSPVSSAEAVAAFGFPSGRAMRERGAQ